MSLLNVKSKYTEADWQAREQYYIDKSSSINIPQQIDGRTIMFLTSRIDELLSEALLELAYMKRNYNNFKNKQMLAEKEVHIMIKEKNFKENGLDGIPMAKVTSDDIKSTVVNYLRYTTLENMQSDIYTVVLNSENRFIFMEAVVKLLSEKKSALIADNAILKLEGSIK